MPPALTVKVTLLPGETIWLCGCAVMDGALVMLVGPVTGIRKSFITAMCWARPESADCTGGTSLNGVYTRESKTSPLGKECEGKTVALSKLVNVRLGNTKSCGELRLALVSELPRLSTGTGKSVR